MKSFFVKKFQDTFLEKYWGFFELLSFFWRKSNIWTKFLKPLGKSSEKYFFWKNSKFFSKIVLMKYYCENFFENVLQFFRNIFRLKHKFETFVKKCFFERKIWNFFTYFLEFFLKNIWNFLKFFLKKFLLKKNVLKSFWKFFEK